MTKRLSVELLQQRIRRGLERQREESGAQEERIERRRDEGPAPLSFSQQRLWFLQRLKPDSAAFNIARAYRLRGDLDPGALARALRRLAERQQVLRTVVREVEGPGRQVVLDRFEPPFTRVDLRDAADPWAEVERLRHDDLVHPFDLEAAPPWRVRLLDLGVRDGERCHVLLLNVHHILLDGWSLPILLDELAALYGEEARGAPAELPELPVQYADYAAWQRQRLDGAHLERLVGWWKQHLEGAPDVVELAADHPRPPVPSYRGARESRPLPVDLSAAVRGYGERGITPFMVGLACFATLLYRYTGRDDLVIGSPIAGRTHSELEGLLGFFVNTLALRVDLGGDPSFNELLERVRRTTLGAYEHQEAPFEVLVERLAPQRRLSHTPLFQALFTVRREGRWELRLPGVEVERLPRQRVPAQFDLNLTLVERGDGLSAELLYSLDLFREDTAHRLLASFEALLVGALAEPGRRLSELPILNEEEWYRVVEQPNRTARPYEREGTVHGQFRLRAAETPEAPALAWLEGGAEEGAVREMSYAALDDASDRLARRLAAAGVEPGQAVAVAVERSPLMVVTLLAVFKVGAFYVPLDPDYPRERLGFMLADSDARLLVTTEQGASSLPRTDVPRLVLDGEPSAGGGAQGAAPDRSPGPLAPAYVMYTSGSTGRPKGVVVAHRAVLRLVRNADFAAMGPAESWLQAAPAAFDATTLELWAPLLNGGRLALAPPGKLNLDELVRVVQRLGVTSAWFTAGLFHQLVETHLGDLGGLHQLLAGGDVLSPAHVERVLRELPGTRMINGYGPTENTTFTACHDVGLHDPSSTVPIGRPISNTTVLILDPRQRPLPVGVPGELCAGGDGLALGYLGRPALTAERFIPDPQGDGGQRLYRTGDLARWLPDGSLDFLGRIDNQVKIRGFRVEPGETEVALAALPGVRAAAVVVGDRPSGQGKRLVAYAVVDGGIGAPDLRRALEERLPEYMVPAVFVLLDELPLDPNGKVDRRALPEPDAGREMASSEYVAPQDRLQEELASLWTDLLGIDRLGVEDDFFELGGHSLLATRLAVQVRRRYGVEVPLMRLFEEPTVAGLAAWIAGQKEARGDAPGDGPEPLGRDEPLPLSYGQERLWFLERMERGETRQGTALYLIAGALRLRGLLDAAALGRAVGRVVERHEALRTRFLEIDGQPWQEVVVPPAVWPLPRVDLSALPAKRREEAARAVLRREHHRPMDLGGGLLLRTLLLRLEPAEHVLSWVMHHIASDGWSVGVLLRELGIYYRRESGEEGSAPPEPPALPVGYPDFAVWQRRRLESADMEHQVEHWRRRLAGAPEALDLPTDRPRPRVQTFHAGTLRRRLDGDLSRRAGEAAAAAGATPFVVLLAALATVLSRQAGQDDVLIGAPAAGRERPEVEDLIGFFLNTLVLRLDLSPGDGDTGPGFAALVERAREVATTAYAHQELPFERLLEELKPERDLSRTPLFQVMLNLVPPLDGFTGVPDLAAERLELPAPHSKFDLTIYADTGSGDGGYRLIWVYNRDLFDAARMEELANQLEVVLDRGLAQPERPVHTLPLLTAAAARVLEDPRRPLPAEWDGAVHRQIARRAAAHPDRPAVADGETAWTYGELSARTMAVAIALAAAGVRPGEVVAIHGARSAGLVPAVLGVLRAGAAFTVLDPVHPPARRAEMVGAVAARALLTVAGEVEPEVLEALGDTPQVVLSQALADVPGMLTRSFRECEVTAEDVAYVAFTSGSTGRPKGIVGTHGALVRYLPHLTAEIGMGEGERVSLLAGLSHDPLHRDLFTPLQLGGFLAVPDGDRLGEPGYLARWMGEQGITHVHLTPAMCQLVTEPVERGQTGLLPALRRVIFYGEKVGHRDVERLLVLAPQVTAYVSYGATETSRAASYHRVTDDDLASGRPLALGDGGPDSQLVVLSRRGGRAGVGELGELWMRGPNLARGYLADAAGTADRWRPHPFAAEPGERIYRTGDLGRYRPDGEVVYAGRTDDQVKIRGFRVEPAEVERVLAAAPEVARVAVVPRRDDARGTYLAAFFVAKGEAVPDPAALRARCAEHLPEYMVPLAFAELTALPMTANNKLDRDALPKPEPVVPEVEHELPRSPLEELVVELWRELLQVHRVGIHDSFFDLGGHSLLATRAVSRLRRAVGVEVPLRELFENPTAAELAPRVEERMRRAGGGVLPPIEPRPRDPERRPGPEDLPLSFSQERQWFLEEIDPGSPAYRIPTAVRIDGPLEPPVLARALDALVRRHEALRTTFPRRWSEWEEGEPVQRVFAADSPVARAAARLAMIDLSALPRQRREAEALRWRRVEAGRPMDLAAGPLLRTRLFRLGEEEHQLFFVLHHIVTDGWSNGVILREMAALVDAFATGAPSPLPPLPLQYGDFALWQRQWMRGEVLDAQLAYWRDELAGVPVLELPTDRPRPALQTHRGARVVDTLGSELTAALRHLARDRGATLFMVVLAAWKAVLARLSGQDEFAVGTFIAGRNRAELEPLVGFFVNSLALAADVPAGGSFVGLLEGVRRTTLGAYAHQDVPFERLLQELVPERDLSRSPIFQVMIVGLDVGRVRETAGGRRWQVLPRESDRAAVDMTLWIYEAGDDVRLELEYNRDLFDATTAQATLGRVVRVLEAVSAQGGGAPDVPLAELPLIGAGERNRLLVERNDTVFRPPGLATPVHVQISERACRQPDHPAVETTDGAGLTYAELDAAAGRLARRLRALGVGPDVPVGVCLERSPEMIVALLAVFRAGGAYLPLDPTYPAERLAFQVTDSGAPAVVTREGLAAGLADTGAELLDVAGLDTLDVPEVQLPETPPQSAAYLIYTSGSTGRPKGVVVSHGALSAFVAGSAEVTGVGPSDRVLQFLSISFDASVEELWPTLARGGTLVLRDDDMLASPGRFLERCGELEITVLDLPTAFWHQIAVALGEGEGSLPASLRLTIAGGEAVLPEGLDAWRRGGGDAHFLNTYGPTEATCVATLWGTPVPAGRGDADGHTVPIGRPMPNVRVLLLDDRQRLVPEGVAGEIVLGGAGVARGYLGRPAATAAAFVPDPWAGEGEAEPGARLYRTGDLGRWRSDGELEFLGRFDDQVKVRGFRVELGEVEAALVRHPQVREAAVTLRRDDGGTSALVGYVVTAGGTLPDDLRDFLRTALPDHMVPSPVVALPELPKTPGGKVDRKALPEPGPGATTGAGYAEPTTLVEELLVEIWAEVLGLGRVGTEDDFFALGGHSLLATRVVNGLAREIDLEMPVRSLFEAPVLKDLAKLVEQRLLEEASDE